MSGGLKVRNNWEYLEWSMGSHRVHPNDYDRALIKGMIYPLRAVVRTGSYSDMGGPTQFVTSADMEIRVKVPCCPEPLWLSLYTHEALRNEVTRLYQIGEEA